MVHILYVLVLIMLSSATISVAVAAISLLLVAAMMTVVTLHLSLNLSMAVGVAVAVALAVVAVVAVSGCGRGCRCGRGSRGRDGLRCPVNADDAAGFGSCEVEDGFGLRRWHRFAAHHLGAHHTGSRHFVVVRRIAMRSDGWVSPVAAIATEVSLGAAWTAGAATTAWTPVAERTDSRG